MLVEQHIDGYVRDKVAIAIDRLRAFEPEEGYYLAFSGGKDSQCIYHLAVEAGVKFDAHYNLTTVDPPELVRFIKSNYKDVSINYPKTSMWRLIEEKMIPPTRISRWCCDVLKEGGGEGRIVATGVRWAESRKRKNNRGIAEVTTSNKHNKIKLMNDNKEERRMFENCTIKGKRVVNAIIDWQDEDVWEYLNGRNIEHCSLYDEGWKRLGCIGCPLSSNMEKELNRWPKYKENYRKAFGRMLEARKAKGKDDSTGNWTSADGVMDWWINGSHTDYTNSFLEEE